MHHSSASYAVALAEVAEVERVLLTHHHPERTDDEIDAIVERYRSAPSLVEGAAVGRVLDI